MTQKPAARLRRLLQEEGLRLCPGVTNPLYARVAEEEGFEVLYATGAGITNASLGLPDLALLTMTEMLTATRGIVAAVDIPVIADIDTGYGGGLNVTRAVREFEAVGVAGLQIEDQVSPKRCGHFDGKEVVELSEMLERVIAAVEARTDPDLVIVARTDAIASEGLDAALDRCSAYVEAGADMVFVEAPRTLEELRAIPPAFSVPVLVNMVEGGKTPLVGGQDLADMGYKVALYANAALRMAVAGVRRGLRTLRETGNTAAVQNEMLAWEERQALVGLDDWSALREEIRAKVEQVMKRRSHR